ncbi:hypothetical protein [Nocardia sp. NPDC050793]|uniref:hypothetical protein n=1 Tax=Nocardia sp. NPDC050793 TaxID=3155159 RepID=UPI003402C537
MANQSDHPSRPIFRGDPGEWARGILAWGAPPELEPVTARARAVAVAVFYAAADWSQIFGAPVEFQIHAWAVIFDRFDWLTVDLAERAVHAHFRESITGQMLPAHVIQGAAVLKLEEVP